MKKIISITFLVVMLLIGYLYTKKQVNLNVGIVPTTESIPTQLPSLFPNISWTELRENTGDEVNKPTTYREGMVSVSAMGDSDGVYDSSELITKFLSIGWTEIPPDGASGPFTSYTRLSKQINESKIILKIMVENTTMTQMVKIDRLSVKCPCNNKITVTQEK